MRRAPAPGGSRTACNRTRSGVRGKTKPRQHQCESGAATWLTLYRYVTLHRPRKLTADRQAESGALRRSRQWHFALDEWLENPVALVSRDAATGVADLDSNTSVVGDAAYVDAAAVGELDCVRQKIEQ